MGKSIRYLLSGGSTAFQKQLVTPTFASLSSTVGNGSSNALSGFMVEITAKCTIATFRAKVGSATWSGGIGCVYGPVLGQFSPFGTPLVAVSDQLNGASTNTVVDFAFHGEVIKPGWYFIGIQIGSSSGTFLGGLPTLQPYEYTCLNTGFLGSFGPPATCPSVSNASNVPLILVTVTPA